MADRQGPDADPAPEPVPAPPATRQLDRAPGERYRSAGGDVRTGAAAPSGGTGARGATRMLVAGAAVAAAGSLLYALLSQVDIGFGLLAVAAFIGWTVAVAMLWFAADAGPFSRRGVVAAALGIGSIVLGLLLSWAWSRVEGGVLGPLDYVDQRYGPVAYLEIAVAGAVAWLRGR